MWHGRTYTSTEVLMRQKTRLRDLISPDMRYSVVTASNTGSAGGVNHQDLGNQMLSQVHIHATGLHVHEGLAQSTPRAFLKGLILSPECQALGQPTSGRERHFSRTEGRISKKLMVHPSTQDDTSGMSNVEGGASLFPMERR